MEEKKRITRDAVPDNFTVKLALFDGVPVIFFALATICLGIFLKSPAFVIGAFISAFAGIFKVIWKLIVAIKGKNIWWMFTQFRLLMPIGFILMILGVFLGRSYMTPKEIISWFTGFPVNIFFGLGLVSLILMLVLAFTLDNSSPKANWIEQAVNGLGQFFIFLGALMLVYLGNYYNSLMTLSEYAEEYSADINIEETDDYYIVSANGSAGERALLFFPGAKVEASAYIPLMKAIVTREGSKTACFVVKPSYNFSFFGSSIADEIIKDYGGKYLKWYIGGHSLGGVEASQYVSDHAGEFDGLILMASYSATDLTRTENQTDENIRVLSILASNDRILSLEEAEKNNANLPEDAATYVIEGGNHGQFGDYGTQDKDGIADITKEEQWEEIAGQIRQFMDEDQNG